MKCPKCGFDQPDDEFCASCGVNVKAYQPHTSLSRRLASSAFFNVAILVIVFISSAYFLFHTVVPRSEQEKMVETINKTTGLHLRKTILPNSSVETPTSPEGETPAAQDQMPSVPKNGEGLPTTNQNAAEGVHNSEGPQETKSLVIDSKPKPPPTKVRLTIYEVDREFLPELLGSLESPGEIGNVVDEINAISFSQRLKLGQERGMVVAGQSSSQAIAPTDDQNPTLFNFSSFDQRLNSEVGLYLRFKTNAISESAINFSIDGRRLIGRDGQVDAANFGKDTSIGLKTPAYIFGLLPHRKPTDSEINAISNNQFLSIMRSEKFQNNVTESLLLFEVSE